MNYPNQSFGGKATLGKKEKNNVNSEKIQTHNTSYSSMLRNFLSKIPYFYRKLVYDRKNPVDFLHNNT
ncbi:hypothetical protein ACSSV5_002008 [Psychroflexus sp. MBR-150]|jgi:hypothetical protein